MRQRYEARANRERSSQDAWRKRSGGRSGCTWLKLSNQVAHILRQRRVPAHLALAVRMHEAETLRVQRLPVKRRQRAPRASSIHRIADERVTDRCEVHAYLVRASGFETALEERRAFEASNHGVVRDRGFAAG